MLFSSRLVWDHEILLGGVDIVATWQMRWINLCGGDAGCRYHYFSNLFNVFFSIQVLQLFGFKVFSDYIVRLISQFNVSRLGL